MNLEAIYHSGKSNYAYAFNDHELHIRLRTAKNDVSEVFVYIALKHLWHEKKKYAMRKVASDRLFDYYQFNYVTDDTRLGYYFELSDGKSTVIYSESGFSETFDDENSYLHYFQYPYINDIDVCKVPDWVHEAVFYQIFVDRFYNGDKSNDPENLSAWNELPTPKSFYGGDLEGIIQKLGYLEDLGINGIYLTPIFKSPSNHKYDTADYRMVDEAFGDKETLKRLVSKAHEKGIRIILDGVFNHCGFLFAPFQDVLKNGDRSYYKDWFHIDSFPVSTDPVNYRVFSQCPYMPKLNTSNPDLKKYIFDTVEYWTRETGIDGWRLDVSDEVDHCFWRDFRKLVKGINKDAVIIGENWHNAYPWLMGDQFDSVMNYPLTKSCVEFFAQGKINAELFVCDLYHYLMRYYDQVNYTMLNLLDSHDTVRFLTCCGNDKRKLKLAVLFLHCYVGIPCTYYGSEIGLAGKGDPDCRRTFDWNEDHWDKELRDFYKKVIKIRKTHQSLKAGTIKMHADGGLVFIEREADSEKTLVILNNTENSRPVTLPCGEATELLSGRSYKNKATIPPMSGYIFELK